MSIFMAPSRATIVMLITKSTKVSARLSIVFTCFLISFAIKAQINTNNSLPTNFEQSDAHELLQEKVYKHLLHELNPATNDSTKIIVRSIDKRIDIPHCQVPLTFQTNGAFTQQSNMSVKVECPSTNWYLFTHATVVTIQQVVTVTDNISPGTLLTNSNVALIEVDKNKLRGSAFFKIEDVIGARIKRRIRAGSIVDDRMLCFVCKGDRVTIAAISGGLSLKVYGVAEEDGVLGDTIQVRNLSSDKLVYAQVASTTEVQIRI